MATTHLIVCFPALRLQPRSRNCRQRSSLRTRCHLCHLHAQRRMRGRTACSYQSTSSCSTVCLVREVVICALDLSNPGGLSMSAGSANNASYIPWGCAEAMLSARGLLKRRSEKVTVQTMTPIVQNSTGRTFKVSREYGVMFVAGSRVAVFNSLHGLSQCMALHGNSHAHHACASTPAVPALQIQYVQQIKHIYPGAFDWEYVRAPSIQDPTRCALSSLVYCNCCCTFK